MAVTVSIDRGALESVLAPSGPLGTFLLGEGRAVEVGAKQRCPIDEGELRDSSEVTVTRSELVTTAVVAFNAPHAAFVHGSSGNPGRSAPHWPPSSALVSWARRHGFPNTFLVARAIALRGSPLVPFLTDSGRARYGAVGR